MKKKLLMIFTLSLILLPFISSAPCEISVSKINQDPFFAIPGDYVKVVFQIDGIANTECGTVTFGLKENYPISFDSNGTNERTINSGTFQRTYSSFYLATYKLRIDENAIEGENPIEFYYTNKNGPEIIEDFDINVKDTRADFKVYVKEYNYLTRELTLQILNIAESDAELVRIEIPKQDNIVIKGSNIEIAGDIDSNEYTTVEFEAIPSDGDIKLLIEYQDLINVERIIEKTIHFDSSYFMERNGDKKSGSIWIYIIIALVIIWIIYKRVKKAQMKKKLREKARHQ
jgi:hypothetical protein